NYKPPFTKLTMKLKPEKLGEIDVTMVQRGNNVHINLSSNSQALAMLQQQSGDLKMALTELGFGEASMKFTQGDQSRQQQQQHSTNERYQEMAKLDDNIEMLELIVPKYG
ncbi:MAG: flagellar hook-length control protein FliK, partial [Thiovulaceae bacterium]|nr:flagellar hook-length control protein FliK [Sulfurimonadaceae bacterium]